MTDFALDPRIHAFDSAARVAESALRGQLPGEGWRYLGTRPLWAGPGRLSLLGAPEDGAEQVTEALPGEALALLWENREGWARVRTVHDGYLGWVRVREPQPQPPAAELLPVTALRAHAYAGPGLRQPLVGELALGAQVGTRAGEVVEEQGRRWVPVTLGDGAEAWVQAAVFSPIPGDVADLALRFLDAPYVWGGRSAWGLDCSGLTQVVYAAHGRALPRDADQQQAALQAVEAPVRGDLAFFPGHVGLMLDERRMVHANATHMRVSIETLGEGEYGTRLQESLEGFGRWPG
ncbi:NlpC/P60 family protein [Deinococcus multiflagellatus]|uniref:NlpC/P60 family protein n=1 Tax=Deinococcus multiflagellatus TaxID=1656887 RepID=A0ABW1ZH64_9DEIO|nr:NlpC/P60 family protein [Deinococcus multiflagellatus]